MKTMMKMSGTLKAALWVALLGTAFVSLANAQCLNLTHLKATAFMLQSAPLRSQPSPAAFVPVVYPAEGTSVATAAEPIVGFWYMKFTSDTPGLFFDWGYSQFHGDGSEILNSGTGARKFCLGAWKKTGPSQYVVNHFAIAYTYGTAPSFIGIVNIRETITVGSGHNSFSGTFTVGIYDQAGDLLGAPNGPGLVTGKIEAHRITVDTPVTDVLPAVAP